MTSRHDFKSRRESQTQQGDETTTIKVCVRIRPLMPHELSDDVAVRSSTDENNRGIVEVLLNQIGNKETTRRFPFDVVAGPEVNQERLFDDVGLASLLDDALHGINVSVFAYGQTGSGKTFTMSGLAERINSENPIHGTVEGTLGIIPRAIDYLFRRIEKDRQFSHSSVSLRAAMAEVYNENVYDLLNMTGEALPVRYNQGQGFFVQGQIVVPCDDINRVINVLSEGQKNRSIGSHALNMDSSRSHSILTLYIERRGPHPETGDMMSTHSKVVFVDLAGSERLKSSKSTNHTALETRQINKSLFTLGKVISALSEKAERMHRKQPQEMTDAGAVFVPYRDSTLTKLLADSLGGSAKTLMLSCVSPAMQFLEESLNTLQYALRASRIENAPLVQMDSKDAQVLAARRENVHLRTAVALLRAHIGLPVESAESANSFDSAALEAELLELGRTKEQEEQQRQQQLRALETERDEAQENVRLLREELAETQEKLHSLSTQADGFAATGRPLAPARLPPLRRHGESDSRSKARKGTKTREKETTAATVFASSSSLAAPAAAAGAGAGALTAQLGAGSGVDRAGTRMVLDVQQAELAALSQEREELSDKLSAAKARVGSLLRSLADAKRGLEGSERENAALRAENAELERKLVNALRSQGVSLSSSTLQAANTIASKRLLPNSLAAQGTQVAPALSAPSAASSATEKELELLKDDMSTLASINASMEDKILELQRRELELVQQLHRSDPSYFNSRSNNTANAVSRGTYPPPNSSTLKSNNSGSYRSYSDYQSEPVDHDYSYQSPPQYSQQQAQYSQQPQHPQLVNYSSSNSMSYGGSANYDFDPNGRPELYGQYREQDTFNSPNYNLNSGSNNSNNGFNSSGGFSSNRQPGGIADINHSSRRTLPSLNSNPNTGNRGNFVGGGVSPMTSPMRAPRRSNLPNAVY